MVLAFLVIYFLLLVWLMKRHVPYAIGLFIISLPTYLIRFKLGPLPSTMLEAGFGGIACGWLIFQAREVVPELWKFCKQHRVFVTAILLFLISSASSIWVSDMAIASLGQWRAYFLEPIVLFFILISLKNKLAWSDLRTALVLSTLSISIYAIVQQFTGLGIATEQWTNPETRRVTAFFTSPNAVTLYLGPIVMLLAAALFPSIQRKFFKITQGVSTVEPLSRQVRVLFWVALGLALVATVFTRSQGGFLALAVGGMVFLFLVGYKKIVLAVTALAVMLAGMVAFFPNALPIHYQSGGNRVRLWTYSINYLTESPSHFILGTGIRQFFRKIQKPFYNPKQMERIIYPHNVVLNFWTEIGLFGMVAFVVMYGYLLRVAYGIYKRKEVVLGAGLSALLVAFIVHGMLDVPYFKNDLAMEWWILSALIFLYQKQSST